MVALAQFRLYFLGIRVYETISSVDKEHIMIFFSFILNAFAGILNLAICSVAIQNKTWEKHNWLNASIGAFNILIAILSGGQL